MSYIKSISEINEEEYNKLITIEDSDRKTFYKMIEDIADKSLFQRKIIGEYEKRSDRIYKIDSDKSVKSEYNMC